MAQLEIELIEAEEKRLLEWNQNEYENQIEWLWIYRAETLIDKLKIYQYKYNIQMYKYQLAWLKEQKNSTENIN